MSDKPIPLKIDSRGRLTLPQKLRKKLGVENGDVLFLVKSSEGTVVLYTMGKLVESARVTRNIIKEKQH